MSKTKIEAANLDELLAAVERTEDADWSDGESAGLVAADLPTWGERTTVVEERVNASGPDGEILSWDTTGTVTRMLIRSQDSGRRVYRIEEVSYYAAIDGDGNLSGAVYGVGTSEAEAIDDAAQAAREPEVKFSAVPMTAEAYAYVQEVGGLPDRRLDVSRRGVTLREE